MRAAQRRTLARIADSVPQGALWAVGGSALLERHGLAQGPNDLDLVAAEADFEALRRALSALGSERPRPPKPPFISRAMTGFEIEGEELDLIAGYGTRCEEGDYFLPFDRESIAEAVEIEGRLIPFMALEDWLVLYGLMPAAKRQLKCVKIARSLAQSGVGYPALLARALRQPLPQGLRRLCRALLEGTAEDARLEQRQRALEAELGL